MDGGGSGGMATMKLFMTHCSPLSCHDDKECIVCPLSATQKWQSKNKALVFHKGFNWSPYSWAISLFAANMSVSCSKIVINNEREKLYFFFINPASFKPNFQNKTSASWNSSECTARFLTVFPPDMFWTNCFFII